MIGDISKIAGLASLGILGILLLFAFVFTVGGLFWGWVIMLVAGMVWHEFGVGAPIGFFPVSFGFGVLFSVVMTALGAGSRN